MEKKELIEKIHTQILDNASYGENPTACSWITEEGVILSSNDANYLLNYLKQSEVLEEAIKEVLEVLDGNGVPNIDWVKNRLLESI